MWRVGRFTQVHASLGGFGWHPAGTYLADAWQMPGSFLADAGQMPGM